MWVLVLISVLILVALYSAVEYATQLAARIESTVRTAASSFGGGSSGGGTSLSGTRKITALALTAARAELAIPPVRLGSYPGLQVGDDLTFYIDRNTLIQVTVSAVSGAPALLRRATPTEMGLYLEMSDPPNLWAFTGHPPSRVVSRFTTPDLAGVTALSVASTDGTRVFRPNLFENTTLLKVFPLFGMHLYKNVDLTHPTHAGGVWDDYHSARFGSLVGMFEDAHGITDMPPRPARATPYAVVIPADYMFRRSDVTTPQWPSNHCTGAGGTKRLTVGSASLMFSQCSVKSLPDMLIVARGGSTFKMFSVATDLTVVSNLRVEGSIDARDMFRDCAGLTKIALGTSVVTLPGAIINGMFHGCRVLGAIEDRVLRVHGAEHAYEMFKYCGSDLKNHSPAMSTAIGECVLHVSAGANCIDMFNGSNLVFRGAEDVRKGKSYIVFEPLGLIDDMFTDCNPGIFGADGTPVYVRVPTYVTPIPGDTVITTGSTTVPINAMWVHLTQ